MFSGAAPIHPRISFKEENEDGDEINVKMTMKMKMNGKETSKVKMKMIVMINPVSTTARRTPASVTGSAPVGDSNIHCN